MGLFSGLTNAAKTAGKSALSASKKGTKGAVKPKKFAKGNAGSKIGKKAAKLGKDGLKSAPQLDTKSLWATKSAKSGKSLTKGAGKPGGSGGAGAMGRLGKRGIGKAFRAMKSIRQNGVKQALKGGTKKAAVAALKAAKKVAVKVAKKVTKEGVKAALKACFAVVWCPIALFVVLVIAGLFAWGLFSLVFTGEEIDVDTAGAERGAAQRGYLEAIEEGDAYLGHDPLLWSRAAALLGPDRLVVDTNGYLSNWVFDFWHIGGIKAPGAPRGTRVLNEDPCEAAAKKAREMRVAYEDTVEDGEPVAGAMSDSDVEHYLFPEWVQGIEEWAERPAGDPPKTAVDGAAEGDEDAWNAKRFETCHETLASLIILERLYEAETSGLGDDDADEVLARYAAMLADQRDGYSSGGLRLLTTWLATNDDLWTHVYGTPVELGGDGDEYGVALCELVDGEEPSYTTPFPADTILVFHSCPPVWRDAPCIEAEEMFKVLNNSGYEPTVDVTGNLEEIKRRQESRAGSSTDVVEIEAEDPGEAKIDEVDGVWLECELQLVRIVCDYLLFLVECQKEIKILQDEVTIAEAHVAAHVQKLLDELAALGAPNPGGFFRIAGLPREQAAYALAAAWETGKQVLPAESEADLARMLHGLAWPDCPPAGPRTAEDCGPTPSPVSLSDLGNEYGDDFQTEWRSGKPHASTLYSNLEIEDDRSGGADDENAEDDEDDKALILAWVTTGTRSDGREYSIELEPASCPWMVRYVYALERSRCARVGLEYSPILSMHGYSETLFGDKGEGIRREGGGLEFEAELSPEESLWFERAAHTLYGTQCPEVDRSGDTPVYAGTNVPANIDTTDDPRLTTFTVEYSGWHEGQWRRLSKQGHVHKCLRNLTVKIFAAVHKTLPELNFSSVWRSKDRQLELRRLYCREDLQTPHPDGWSYQIRLERDRSMVCQAADGSNNPVALPGTSAHNAALAIDFRPCSSELSTCFRILTLLNPLPLQATVMPSEPWHWSTQG